MSKGYKFIAPLIGFFEILIWLIVISKIMHNLSDWYYYIAYAGGFAAGNYIGIRIEEKLAIGTELIRIITKKDASELIEFLRDEGYGVTSIKAQGIEGKVDVIYIIVKRNNLEKIKGILMKYNPNALYTIEDIRFVNKPLSKYLKLDKK